MLIRGVHRIAKYLGISYQTVQKYKNIGIFKTNTKFKDILEYDHQDLDLIWTEFKRTKQLIIARKRYNRRKLIEMNKRNAIARRKKCIENGIGSAIRRYRNKTLYDIE